MSDTKGRTFVIRILKDPDFIAFEQERKRNRSSQNSHEDQLPFNMWDDTKLSPGERRMRDVFVAIGASPEDFVDAYDHIDMRWICPKPLNSATMKLLSSVFPRPPIYPNRRDDVSERSNLNLRELLIAATAPPGRIDEYIGDHRQELAHLTELFGQSKALWICRYRLIIATLYRMPAIVERLIRLWYSDI